MVSLLNVFVISASGLALITLVLRIEDARGRRIFLRYVRGKCDIGLEAVGARLDRVYRVIGGGVLRQIFHYIIHLFLRLLLAGVRGLEYVLRKLQRTNRNVAHTIALVDTESQLSEVSEHAKAIKLSPEEKRQKRRAMLE